MVRNLISKAEILIIVLLACIPLFLHLPYRVNIFLSWEGAYRMSEGQLPFRDFGIPLGGMYWAIPAVFFKLLGPKMITLIKAQVFINIIAGFSFRSILKSLEVDKGVRTAAILLFCISYSFVNFWPWYNHSVIVYELAALACLFRYTAGTGAAVVRGGLRRMGWLAAAALLTIFSFLTKQDGGGMTFFLCCALLAVYGLIERSWRPFLVYAGSFAGLLLLIVLPFLQYGFGYWFNHGQAPHTARVSVLDIADEFFGASQWIKFYLFIILVLVLARFRDLSVLRKDRQLILLVVLSLGILGEGAVFQVTSYTPPDNNIFFHSFAFASVLSLLGSLAAVDFQKPRLVLVLSLGIMIWWSGSWWKYTQRVFARVLPHKEDAVVSATGENVINKSTYMINRDTVSDVPLEQWIECGLRSFDKIYMPEPTVAGIHRLMNMPLVKEGKGALRVLNMSELTPLAAEIPYALEKNPRMPLWYHLGVGMFNRQTDSFASRIRDRHYDLILFEYIPTLNNFYPFRLRDSLQLHYRLTDVFLAPRRGPETKGNIEVYIRPADSLSMAGK